MGELSDLTDNAFDETFGNWRKALEAPPVAAVKPPPSNEEPDQSVESWLGFVKAVGLTAKMQGEDVRAGPCPFCGNKALPIFIKALSAKYRCLKCKSEGQVLDLLRIADTAVPKYLQEKSTKPRLNFELLREQLSHPQWGAPNIAKFAEDKWGITAPVAEQFKVGLWDRGESKWLVIPYYDAQGTPSNARCILVSSIKAKSALLEGCSVSLFNLVALEGKDVVVAPDELTVLRLAASGVDAVGLPVKFKNWQRQWSSVLMDKDKVTFLLPRLVAESHAAMEIISDIGPERCWIAELPEGDAPTTDELKALVGAALPFGSAIASAGDVWKEFLARLDRKEEQGLPWPWPSVQDMLGPIRTGGVYLIGGLPGEGKTTLALNIAARLLLDKRPGIIYSLDMEPVDVLVRLACHVWDIAEPKLKEVAADLQGAVSGWPLYFARPDRKLSAEFMLDAMRRAITHLGVAWIVFDHLHWMQRGTSHRGHLQAMEWLSGSFCDLARETGTSLFLIVQPRKLQGEQITLMDIRGSLLIVGDADMVLGLESAKKLLEDERYLRILKTRFSGGKGKAVKLVLDGAKATFTAVAESTPF